MSRRPLFLLNLFRNLWRIIEIHPKFYKSKDIWIRIPLNFLFDLGYMLLGSIEVGTLCSSGVDTRVSEFVSWELKFAIQVWCLDSWHQIPVALNLGWNANKIWFGILFSDELQEMSVAIYLIASSDVLRWRGDSGVGEHHVSGDESGSVGNLEEEEEVSTQTPVLKSLLLRGLQTATVKGSRLRKLNTGSWVSNRREGG